MSVSAAYMERGVDKQGAVSKMMVKQLESTVSGTDEKPQTEPPMQQELTHCLRNRWTRTARNTLLTWACSRAVSVDRCQIDPLGQSRTHLSLRA